MSPQKSWNLQDRLSRRMGLFFCIAIMPDFTKFIWRVSITRTDMSTRYSSKLWRKEYCAGPPTSGTDARFCLSSFIESKTIETFIIAAMNFNFPPLTWKVVRGLSKVKRRILGTLTNCPDASYRSILNDSWRIGDLPLSDREKSIIFRKLMFLR